MKILIVITFVAVALFAYAPYNCQARTASGVATRDAAVRHCYYQYIFDVWRNRVAGTLSEDRFCDIYNNYVICLVAAYTDTGAVFSEEDETDIETKLEKVLSSRGISCELDVDRAIAEVKRRR